MAKRGPAVRKIPKAVQAATQRALPGSGDLPCCVRGCKAGRRPAGHGHSRFCYSHHHLFYTAQYPDKMERKRATARARYWRLKAAQV